MREVARQSATAVVQGATAALFCPQLSQQPTFIGPSVTSALCHIRTFACSLNYPIGTRDEPPHGRLWRARAALTNHRAMRSWVAGSGVQSL